MSGPPIGDGGPLPDLYLETRKDHRWELYHKEERVAQVLERVEPILVRIQALMTLGADVMEDDEFSDLVDEMYRTLRDGLTRQDLLWCALLHLHGRIEDKGPSMVRQALHALSATDSATGWQEHLGS